LADLPLVRPSALDLVVNFKTAKALRHHRPRHCSSQADEVIE
jgi:hypothetical protein